jgi:hypothetical protein
LDWRKFVSDLQLTRAFFLFLFLFPRFFSMERLRDEFGPRQKTDDTIHHLLTLDADMQAAMPFAEEVFQKRNAQEISRHHLHFLRSRFAPCASLLNRNPDPILFAHFSGLVASFESFEFFILRRYPALDPNIAERQALADEPPPPYRGAFGEILKLNITGSLASIWPAFVGLLILIVPLIMGQTSGVGHLTSLGSVFSSAGLLLLIISISMRGERRLVCMFVFFFVWLLECITGVHYLSSYHQNSRAFVAIVFWIIGMAFLVVAGVFALRNPRRKVQNPLVFWHGLKTFFCSILLVFLCFICSLLLGASRGRVPIASLCKVVGLMILFLSKVQYTNRIVHTIVLNRIFFAMGLFLLLGLGPLLGALGNLIALSELRYWYDQHVIMLVMEIIELSSSGVVGVFIFFVVFFGRKKAVVPPAILNDDYLSDDWEERHGGDVDQSSVPLSRNLNQFLNAEAENLPEDELCAVCLNSAMETKFDPCGHVACCQPCSEEIILRQMQCPFCRKDIQAYTKIEKK